MTLVPRFLVVITLFILVSGCANWTAMYEIEDPTHPIGRPLSDERIRQAIAEGAQAAGWRTKRLSKDSLLATYEIRHHTMHFEIRYTDSYYSLKYRGSDQMKMYCSESDWDKRRKPKVSGQDKCPAGAAPLYVHGKVQWWVDDLNAAIQKSLASI